MRMLLLGGALAVLVSAGDIPAAAHAARATSLTITYMADSARPAEAVRWTLRCDPPGGTHPRRAAVCRQLARLGWRAFGPAPRDTACADIFGGPQVALVRGRVAGRPVWARLSRIDGCQMERWRRIPSLLPAGGAS